MNKIVKTTAKSDLVRTFLQSMNGIYNLTGKELAVLTGLVEAYIANPKAPDILSTANRQLIQSKAKISPANLSHILQKLKENGFILPDKTGLAYRLNQLVIPDIVGDRVQMTIILKGV